MAIHPGTWQLATAFSKSLTLSVSSLHAFLLMALLRLLRLYYNEL